ncbi:MAG TPA: hypothetical protein VF103_18515 [Polyangiaceae bacterium]
MSLPTLDDLRDRYTHAGDGEPPAAAVPLLVVQELQAEQAAAEQAAADAAAPEKRAHLGESSSDQYQYGPPPTEIRESNYISDENLLVWLAQKQEGLYGELRDHMDTSRARSKLIADLNHLNESIDDDDNPAEVSAKIDGLLAAYEGTPFEAELTELLAPLEASLDVAAGTSAQAPNQDNDEINDIKAALKSKIDELGRDDQLELVQIQSLTADIREAGQLASNLIASSNQAANTIVGNIGR